MAFLKAGSFFKNLLVARLTIIKTIQKMGYVVGILTLIVEVDIRPYMLIIVVF
jgi:hypothetical protein